VDGGPCFNSSDPGRSKPVQAVHIHAKFVNGPLDGITYSSNSDDPRHVAIAELVYWCTDSLREGTRVRFTAQTIGSAREHDLVPILPLLREYLVLKSSCDGEDIRARLYHIPVVG
jgi:hypothetical protein